MPGAYTMSVEMARGWRADRSVAGERSGMERLELVADRRLRMNVTKTA